MRRPRTGTSLTVRLGYFAAGALLAGGLFFDAILAETAATADKPLTRAYAWRLPPGFSEPLVPIDNPMSDEKVALGCRLFFDKRLSVTQTYSCSSCHRPELAFTDGRALAVGATGESVRRSAMSLANVAYAPAYTWASDRVVSLEAQMKTPLFGTHPVEMGLSDKNDALPNALRNDERYLDAFRNSFPNEISPASMRNVIKAIATFERTLISGRSAFDRYVFDDDRATLSESARRGMTLFYAERIGCAHCHFGVNFSGPLVHTQTTNARALFVNTALYNIDGSGNYPASDTGLHEVSRKRQDMGRFRVPTLRNVALTAPYMHDGSVTTLDDVLQHYATAGRQTPHGPGSRNRYKDAKLQPFTLSNAERADLIAFLHALTDVEFVDPSRYACGR